MTLKVGRVGTDVSLRDPSEWNTDGNRASVAGFLSAATQADVNVLREQLLGYADNPDEEVIPVTWTVDSRVDGFYRVLGVQVSEDPGHRVAFSLPYRLELERVAGFAAPVFESIVVGALRTNAHGIASATSQPWHAAPGDATVQRYTVPGVTLTSALNRVGADGSIFYYSAGAAPNFYDATPRYFVAPEDWYQNAAKIEAGTTLRTVTGKQITNLPDNWRVSNGLVRIIPIASTTQMLFDVEWYDGTQWESLKRFKILPSPFVNVSHHAVTVLRNSVEEVSIRNAYASAASDLPSEHTIDVTLRRGARMVNLYLTTTLGATNWGIQRNTAEAATAITGGIRATANDASGNQYVLTTSLAKTNDLVNGGFTATAAVTALDFGIGAQMSASTEDTAQNLIYQYMAAQAERMIVAAR